MNSYLNIFCLASLCLSLFSSSIQAQVSPNFNAIVVDHQDQALVGASINWQDTTIGTVTDLDGWFSLPRLDTTNMYILEINYVGLDPVLVEIFPYEDSLKLTLENTANIEEISVEATERGIFNSTLNPINTETLTACELKRAACCNLAESFENNATVNVGYTDAVTGAKEIEMLGLRGTYTQMLIETRPAFNRLGRIYGMEYIPGTWVESIQISKGASSVRNGSQGIAGQINTQLIKPHESPALFVNIFGNIVGRAEANIHTGFKINDKWSTGLLLHGNYFQTDVDWNKDGFLDIPKKQQINGMWRTNMQTEDWFVEFNIHGILDERFGGQTAKISSATNLYEIENTIRRVEAFGKTGFIGFDNIDHSIALIYNGSIHEQRSSFGNRRYDALQRDLYFNLLHKINLGNKDHHLNSGISYQFTNFQEQFSDINLDRNEHARSVYTEYSFSKTFNEDKGTNLSVMAGIRGEWFNIGGENFIHPVPRFNIKYNFSHNFVIRASAGRGLRSPNALVENIRFMPSNRDFLVYDINGLEKAWNYGLNATWNFILGEQEGSLNIDLYRTDFEQRLITDAHHAPDHIMVYLSRQQSFANSFLISYTQDLFKGFEMRLAYKYNDSRWTESHGLEWQMFSPRHRGLMSMHYSTPKEDWQFNLTGQLVGSQRMPQVWGDATDLPAYRTNQLSPTFFKLNAHINYYLKNGLELYVGGENLTNYRQEQPILGADDPFGVQNTNSPAFDASSVYGPVFGAMVYVGFRYTLTTKEKAPKLIEGVAKLEPNHEEQGHVNVTIKTAAHCGMCITNIQNGLGKLGGVDEVDVDLNTNEVTVHYNEETISAQAIRIALTKVGYNADDLKADQKAMQSLPACCQTH
ncbi:MAG: TonB-dependent receptor [Saprospiraceae bacterium]|nr:TonB-dependent receptor [Saprospiraceae bacterium]